MKKIIFVIIIVGMLAATLFGCTTPDVPGSAWALKEVLVYDVLKDNGVDNAGTKFGEAVSTLTRVSGKVLFKNKDNKEYTVGANGTHFSMVTTDLEGNVIMESEFIMDGFKPVASFKMVKYGDKDYSYTGEYGAKYTYTLKDNKAGTTTENATLPISGTYVDNEFLYMYIRCYALENINKQFSLLAPADNAAMNVSVVTERAGNAELVLPGSTEKTKVDIAQVRISRTSVPVGSPIYINYTTYDAEKDTLNLGSKTNKNYHIPILIKEHDIAYKLQDGDKIQITSNID